MSDATANDRPNSGALDLSSLIGRYRRHIPLVLGVMAVVLVADIAYTFTATPKYTGTATIYYAPRPDQISKDQAPQMQDQARDQAVDTQVEVIKSPLIADAVINELGLDHDPDKDFAPKGDDLKLSPAQARDALITRVVKHLKVKRVGQTLLITISYTNANTNKAANIANTFAAKFIQHDINDKLSSSRDANVLLNSQIDDMRMKVEAADAAVEAYKSANGLLGLDKDANTLSQQNIGVINQQLAIARSDEAAARAKLAAAERQLKDGSNGGDVAAALGSTTIGQLRQKRAELSAQVALLQTRYGPMHPDLKNAEAQVQDTDTQIQSEINRILSGLSADVEIAHSKTQSIEASLAGAKGVLSSGAAASVKLAELQRNADAASQLYENVLARVKETSAQQAVSQSDSRIDTPATATSEPSSPNIPLNLLLGLVLGMGLGVGAAAIRERWNAQVTNLDDVEGKLGLAFLGTIPTMQSSIEKPTTKEPIDAVVAHPLSAFAESFRSLATNLLHSNPGASVQILGITSALPSEGKTVTSISVARVQAMSGQSVVLVDCDLRRRSTDILFKGLGPIEAGLTELIEGSVGLDQVLRIDEKSGAHYIPLTSRAHMAKAPFSTPAFDDLLVELRRRYALVVLDTPPLLPVVDTRVLAQKVDALVLLVRWRSTPMNAVKSAVHQLDSVHAPVTGVALSQVNVKAQSYAGYGYPAYYHKEFRRYYQT
jgi:capsular exopolysaccharide synthesis family protein